MISAVEVAEQVNNMMPSIGFCSRSKRMWAYAVTTHMIEELVKNKNGDIDFDKGAQAINLLLQINKKFRKAFFMVVYNFDRVSVGDICALGYMFASEMRKYL